MSNAPAEEDTTAFEIAFIDDRGEPAHIEPVIGQHPARRRWHTVAKNVRSGGYIEDIKRAEFRRDGAVLLVAMPA